jgi:hypothetical protein
MKRILCLAAATIAICLSTASTYAQSESLKLRFNIPFAFTVENTTFSAGEYEVTEPAHLILGLRNVMSQASAFEPAQPARSKKEADGRVRLIFHSYGGEYFLAVVSDGSWASTYDMRPSKEEKRLADASPRPQLKVVSVLSDGTIVTADSGRN